MVYDIIRDWIIISQTNITRYSYILFLTKQFCLATSCFCDRIGYQFRKIKRLDYYWISKVVIVTRTLGKIPKWLRSQSFCQHPFLSDTREGLKVHPVTVIILFRSYRVSTPVLLWFYYNNICFPLFWRAHLAVSHSFWYALFPEGEWIITLNVNYMGKLLIPNPRFPKHSISLCIYSVFPSITLHFRRARPSNRP